MSDFTERPRGADPGDGYVIGLDAGGTKTVGLLSNPQGEIVAKARGVGANLVVHGELAVEKVIYQVIDDLDAPGSIAAVGLGIAGVDRPGEKELIVGMLRRLGLRRSVVVTNDAHIALVAGAPEGRGIVVAAGTGSIAYGATSGGRTARSGGWGYLLGDEGSAFWLGHAALRLGIRAADGRGPETSLYDRVCRRLDLQGASGLVSWFYDQDFSRHRVAELASLVEEAAQDGDEAAEELLQHAALHLARAAEAVARQLVFSEAFPLVLSGGVFKACPSLYERLESAMSLPLGRILRLDVEPAVGAVTLARGQLNP